MKMKNALMAIVVASTLLSSCGTYEATGAVAGARFGSIIGSAVGGITGGWRGSNVGTLVGLAGGAVAGAAIGRAADNQAQRNYQERMEQRQARQQASYDRHHSYDDSGFDPTNSGDDRISMAPPTQGYASSSNGSLVIRNARLMDASQDNTLTRGEEAHMVFEIYNSSSKPVFRVQPDVAEITGNKHIHISENVLIESIPPYQAIRYTAMVKADNRLRDGEAVIRVAVLQNNREDTSQTRTFHIRTMR